MKQLILISGITFAAVLSQDICAEAVIDLTSEQIAAFGITTAPLVPTADTTDKALPAEVVVPNPQLRVVSVPQAGLVEVLLVAEGDSVVKGQILSRMQSPQLLELQRDFLQTLTRVQLAQANYERDRQLGEEGIIAKRRVQESNSEYQSLLTELQEQRESLRLSGMEASAIALLERERKLDSTVAVRAPFDGVVLEQMAVAGQRVAAADPLYKIGQLKPLWLDIHVPLERAESVAIGDRIVLSKYNIEGTVITLGRSVHSADQGVLVRAELNEGAELLRPGQFVEAQLLSRKTDRPQYRVPRSAVVRSGNQVLVFVRVESGFRPHAVEIVSEQVGDLVITTDLSAGTTIAASGTASLKAAMAGAGGEG